MLELFVLVLCCIGVSQDAAEIYKVVVGRANGDFELDEEATRQLRDANG